MCEIGTKNLEFLFVPRIFSDDLEKCSKTIAMKPGRSSYKYNIAVRMISQI